MVLPARTLLAAEAADVEEEATGLIALLAPEASRSVRLEFRGGD